MGQEIPYQHFSQVNYDQFVARLEAETQQLERMFSQSELACSHPVGGLELEAWLVDRSALPRPDNVAFLQCLNHPEVVPELSLFNIELNVAPQPLQGQALTAIHSNLQHNWQACQNAATQMGLDVMAIGTHPALRDAQLTLANMSRSARYKVLNEQILSLREQAPIRLDIHGREHLRSLHYDVMLEAATTSFQIHMQVQPSQAVADYNASQVISAPLLALSANSPYVFGKDLWDESRIPLFEQAIDLGGHKAKRVCFGERYVQDSLMECFTENLCAFEPLIPMVYPEGDGFLPHLRLHNGTIWRWNRPIVGTDEFGKPHVRIENRVVPSGPTLLDMIANAAFYWGSVVYLRDQMDDIDRTLPFVQMKDNFYRAVKNSLNCELVWLDGRCYPVTQLLLEQLLPGAEQGLLALGIEANSAHFWLDIIRQRVVSKQNGASWQRAWVAKHGHNMEALAVAYIHHQHSGKPVHEWAL